MFHIIERFLVFSEISCFYLKSGSMESDHRQEGSVTAGMPVRGVPAIAGMPATAEVLAIAGMPATAGMPETEGMPARAGMPAKAGMPATTGMPATKGMPATAGMLASASMHQLWGRVNSKESRTFTGEGMPETGMFKISSDTSNSLNILDANNSRSGGNAEDADNDRKSSSRNAASSETDVHKLILPYLRQGPGGPREKNLQECVDI